LGKYPFLNVRLSLLSRTLSPGEHFHDCLGPFLPYSLLDTVTKMWKYFTHSETLTYVDVLSEMVASDNRTIHRTIGIPPAEVTWANQTTVSKRLYGRKGPKKSCKFSPGDRVRLSKARRTFKKGYLPNWTEELFTVVKCIETVPFFHIASWTPLFG
jgi:hypothetical protein